VASIGPAPTPGFLIWRLSMKWRAAVDRAVAPLGLTHAQYSLLASLFGMSRRGRRPSQRELAEFTGLESIYVSKLARTLERAGFIDRVQNPDDTRAMQLALTSTGRDVVERAIVAVHALLDELTAPLGGTAGEATKALVGTLQTLLAVPTPNETGPTGTGENQ
jgi:DNA-binding MarR family transcriptional regulator